MTTRALKNVYHRYEKRCDRTKRTAIKFCMRCETFESINFWATSGSWLIAAIIRVAIYIWERVSQVNTLNIHINYNYLPSRMTFTSEVKSMVSICCNAPSVALIIIIRTISRLRKQNKMWSYQISTQFDWSSLAIFAKAVAISKCWQLECLKTSVKKAENAFPFWAAFPDIACGM